MKGRIVDIHEMADEANNKWYQVSIFFEETPNLKLGECEVKQ